MTASVTQNLAGNPRAARDLGRNLDSAQPTFNDILEDQTRVNFYDLEGDFPTPSTLAPNRGIRQYFYTGNYAYSFPLPVRHLNQPQWRGPYGTVGEDLGIQTSLQRKAQEVTVDIEVPNNNSWAAAYEFDDYTRWVDQWPGHDCRYKYTIIRAGWDKTDGAVSTAQDLPWTNSEIPLYLYFTTSPYYARNPTYTFVPPGCTIQLTFELEFHRNAELVLITNTDLEWETNTGEKSNKIQEGGLLRNNKFLGVSFRQVFHNQNINEEPFNNSQFYDPIQLLPAYNVENKHDAIDSNIKFSLNLRETEDARSAQGRNVIGIGNNYADAFPGQVWYEQQPEAKHFWSALYVNYILYQSGVDALRTQSALDYATYGREVDWRNWDNVRKYDIVVFKFKEHSGGHVGFITGFDPATNTVSVIGGNQLNKVKESQYLVDNVHMYLLTIRRNWTDPGENFGILQG